LPCVLYGVTAEKVHGGDTVMHALKFYLYSCICACGMVSGPTRWQLRKKYGLEQQPTFLATVDDCIVSTVPCVNCLTLCQTANEVDSRGLTSSAAIAPEEFDWAPKMWKDATPVAAAPAAAPAQATAEK
jgi:Cys-rich protein (TIGR01571 family)